MDKIQKLIEYYVLEREQMTCLFVLVDSRLEPQKIDLEFMEWLGENGVPFAIIFTKSDKQSSGKTKFNVNRYMEVLKEQWEELPPYFISSSEKKTGRKEILDYIESINNSLQNKFRKTYLQIVLNLSACLQKNSQCFFKICTNFRKTSRIFFYFSPFIWLSIKTKLSH